MGWGKIIGFFIGYLFGGWVGAFLGLIIGYFFETQHMRNTGWYLGQNTVAIKQMKKAFFDATFLVMGYLAKADGRVSEEEIHAARMIMQRMYLNETQKHQAIKLFTQGKKADFNLQQTLENLIKLCHGNRVLLHMFVDIQLRAIQASGPLTQNKRQIFELICKILHYTPFDYQFTDFQQGNRYQYQEQHYHHGGYQRSQTYHRPDKLKQAYLLLGISETANNAEIKRAYRRLMSQHHPDKLVAKGLPEEMLKIATEKAQDIQIAYDQIRTARGF